MENQISDKMKTELICNRPVNLIVFECSCWSSAVALDKTLEVQFAALNWGSEAHSNDVQLGPN